MALCHPGAKLIECDRIIPVLVKLAPQLHQLLLRKARHQLRLQLPEACGKLILIHLAVAILIKILKLLPQVAEEFNKVDQADKLMPSDKAILVEIRSLERAAEQSTGAGHRIANMHVRSGDLALFRAACTVVQAVQVRIDLTHTGG